MSKIKLKVEKRKEVKLSMVTRDEDGNEQVLDMESDEAKAKMKAWVGERYQQFLIENIKDLQIVTLSEPLPCWILAQTARGNCGRPATAAYLAPHPDEPGAWVLMPVCRECASTAVELYEDDQGV
jgi:hypothetical protein